MSPLPCFPAFEFASFFHARHTDTAAATETDTDTLSQSCVYPYFSNIPKVKWYTFSGASHCTNLEIPDKYLEVVSEFLLSTAK